jgi:DNA polymerase-1
MFNALFDMPILENHGISMDGTTVRDVILAAKIYNENEVLSNSYDPETGKFSFSPSGAYRLKRLSKKYLGDWAAEGEHELEAAAQNKGLEAKGEMWLLSGYEVAKYACFDTILTWELEQFYLPKLKVWDTYKLYLFESRLLQKYFYRSAKNGIKLDMPLLKETEQKLREKIEAEIEYFSQVAIKYGVAVETDEGEHLFNPNSDEQMLKLLHALGYDVEATDKFARMPYVRDGDEFMTRFENYSHLFKEWSSYYRAYLEHATSKGRIHPGFFVYGTKAGRPSSSNPNMLQINKNGEIKRVLVADDDYYFVSVDYAQVELRLAAHFSGQPTMIEMINNGDDLHQYTADQLTDMLGFEISRQQGKMLNFGLQYGMGAKKFGETNGIAPHLAKKLVDGWRATYPEMRSALFAVKKLAEQWRTPEGKPTKPWAGRQFVRIPVSGKVRSFDEALRLRTKRTLNGEHDVLPGETYQQYGYEKVADRPLTLEPWSEHYSAFNNIIQGTGWAILERALMECVERWDNDVFRPLLPVYDSSVFLVHKDYAAEIIPQVVEIMENHTDFSVPLTVDVEVGYNYKDLTEWDREQSITEFLETMV